MNEELLNEILKKLEANATYADLIWVGKAYSKADLISDLKKLKIDTSAE